MSVDDYRKYVESCKQIYRRDKEPDPAAKIHAIQQRQLAKKNPKPPSYLKNSEQTVCNPIQSSVKIDTESLDPRTEYRIKCWLEYIGEGPDIIEETLQRCRADPDVKNYFWIRSKEAPRQRRPAKEYCCYECRHWERDTIGDGEGLGECLIKVKRKLLPWPLQIACLKFETKVTS